MSLRLLPSLISRRSPLRFSSPSQIPSTTIATFSTSADKTNLVVNALGTNRVGIVSDISKIVTNSGGNVGESQAAKVGSYFSLTMLLTVPTKNVTDLNNQLTNMEGMNINTLETDTNANSFEVKYGIGYSGRFSLEGIDDPGLVHKITSILSGYGLSIDTMETHEEIAPYGGTTLFNIEGIVTAPKPLPKSFNTAEIAKALSEAGDKLNCDVTLEDNVKRKDRPNWIWENVA